MWVFGLATAIFHRWDRHQQCIASSRRRRPTADKCRGMRNFMPIIQVLGNYVLICQNRRNAHGRIERCASVHVACLCVRCHRDNRYWCLCGHGGCVCWAYVPVCETCINSNLTLVSPNWPARTKWIHYYACIRTLCRYWSSFVCPAASRTVINNCDSNTNGQTGVRSVVLTQSRLHPHVNVLNQPHSAHTSGLSFIANEHTINAGSANYHRVYAFVCMWLRYFMQTHKQRTGCARLG